MIMKMKTEDEAFNVFKYKRVKCVSKKEKRSKAAKRFDERD